MVDNWEDFDLNDQTHFPALGTSVLKQKTPPSSSLSPQSSQQSQDKQSPTASKPADGFLSDSGLRSVHPFFDAQPVVRILPRRKPGEVASTTNGDMADTDASKAHKSLEQREKEYAEARRRILGEDAPTATEPNGQSAKAPSPKPQAERQSGDGKGSNRRGDSKQYHNKRAPIDEAYRRHKPGDGLIGAAPPGVSVPGCVPLLDVNQTAQQLSESLRFEPPQWHYPYAPQNGIYQPSYTLPSNTYNTAYPYNFTPPY